ncbi:MAG: response regulator transcription factor [Armatimonadota bacterium]|nr:response regulator transcription factor [Armatimonadota bacterium]MDR7449768.1 response regulator transcription factor [Armatimonadota bacterium]MDR7458404.1 response regulator transcription factor [Armatimonadota bacterium]MDR7478793.1 response regulator transcription factor [Armatimonadota bacterium]MDR7488816.1 response regulator transcription factor [Armatimonadota bacterium]
MVQTPPFRRITVLIADDHAIVREGVRLLLEAQPDIEVVGEARDGEEAVELARRLRPDVVVLDVSMPGRNGVEATRAIRDALPGTHVLILTMHEEPAYVFQLLRLGAAGYVPKRAAATDLVGGVRTVAGGDTYLHPSMAQELVRDYLGWVRSGGGTGQLDNLTDREREVLALSAEGLTTAQIAERLFISEKTAQTHRAHIMKKLDLHDRALLVRYAVRKGLIPP